MILLKKGFKRSVFWNEYRSKIQRVVSGDVGQKTYTRRTLLDASYQGVNQLFVAGFNDDNDSAKRNSQKSII